MKDNMREMIREINREFVPEEARELWEKWDGTLFDKIENALYYFEKKYKVRLAVLKDGKVMPLHRLGFALVLDKYLAGWIRNENTHKF